MRRLTLPAKFRLRDSVTLDDPLGMGWEWVLRYFGNPDHIKHQEDSGAAEAFEPFLKVQQSCAMAAASEAQARGLKGKAGKDHIARRTNEIFQERLADVDIPLLESRVSDVDGLAEHVVSEVRGVTETDGDEERPVEPSLELTREILTLTDPLPFDFEKEAQSEEDGDFFVPAGTQLGIFYRRWITREAQDLAQFRESALERAGKA